MKLKNINKPTSPFWSKFAAACAAVSAFIGVTGYIVEMEWFKIAGGVIGCAGVFIAVFAGNK